MLFTSYEFILFVGIVLFLYYVLPKKWQWPFLLIASYYFYFRANPSYLLYIVATTVTTYLATRAIQSRKDKFEVRFQEVKKQLSRDERKIVKEKEKKKQFWIMLACLLFNLGILAVVKYTNFAISNVNSLLGVFGSNTELSFVNLILPMGISFYTFQSMGYLIDIYWGKYPAERNPFKFALFVSFFPQLVQGPISRFNDLSQSLFEKHHFDWKTFSFGLQRVLWGFFKKMVIADRLLPAVKVIIDDPGTYTGGWVLVGMLY